MKVMVEEKHSWGFRIWSDRSHSNQWPAARSPRLAFQGNPGCGGSPEKPGGDSVVCKAQFCEGGNPFWGFYLPLGKPLFAALMLWMFRF